MRIGKMYETLKNATEEIDLKCDECDIMKEDKCYFMEEKKTIGEMERNMLSPIHIRPNSIFLTCMMDYFLKIMVREVEIIGNTM